MAVAGVDLDAVEARLLREPGGAAEPGDDFRQFTRFERAGRHEVLRAGAGDGLAATSASAEGATGACPFRRLGRETRPQCCSWTKTRPPSTWTSSVRHRRLAAWTSVSTA
ncbi:hypothetical protein [Streptomyces sp. NPDC057052]|uniref:hypothetical protein n=1 Tax=Streptomyces sp. NPDC057052 TaxID=3346010 RepID=UPI0036253490